MESAAHSVPSCSELENSSVEMSSIGPFKAGCGSLTSCENRRVLIGRFLGKVLGSESW